MGEKIMAIARGACNAFRGDGYMRAVGEYRSLGEIAGKIQRERAISLEALKKETDERTKKLLLRQP